MFGKSEHRYKHLIKNYNNIVISLLEPPGKLICIAKVPTFNSFNFLFRAFLLLFLYLLRRLKNMNYGSCGVVIYVECLNYFIMFAL